MTHCSRLPKPPAQRGTATQMGGSLSQHAALPVARRSRLPRITRAATPNMVVHGRTRPSARAPGLRQRWPSLDACFCVLLSSSACCPCVPTRPSARAPGLRQRGLHGGATRPRPRCYLPPCPRQTTDFAERHCATVNPPPAARRRGCAVAATKEGNGCFQRHRNYPI